MTEPLPSAFTSLYRLVLRASSATVLHNRPARKQLRKVLRPSFEAAVTAIRSLEKVEGRTAAGANREGRKLKTWLQDFDERANNLLSFMHTSALSRGLPHQAIQNLCVLNTREAIFNRKRQRAWHPDQSRDDPVYHQTTERGSRLWKNAVKLKEDAAQSDAVWNMLSETIKLAEGQSGLVLGRPRFVRPVPPWRRVVQVRQPGSIPPRDKRVKLRKGIESGDHGRP